MAVAKSAFPPIGSHGARRQARFRIATLGNIVRRCLAAGASGGTRIVHTRVPLPERLGRRPINGSIEDDAWRFLFVTTMSIKVGSHF
jgi:hypothetical protein